MTQTRSLPVRARRRGASGVQPARRLDPVTGHSGHGAYRVWEVLRVRRPNPRADLVGNHETVAPWADRA